MSASLGGRVDIVPQGESHLEVRIFEDENDKRYRSWSLPVAAAETITRWWLKRSLRNCFRCGGWHFTSVRHSFGCATGQER